MSCVVLFPLIRAFVIDLVIFTETVNCRIVSNCFSNCACRFVVDVKGGVIVWAKCGFCLALIEVVLNTGVCVCVCWFCCCFF